MLIPSYNQIFTECVEELKKGCSTLENIYFFNSGLIPTIIIPSEFFPAMEESVTAARYFIYLFYMAQLESGIDEYDIQRLSITKFDKALIEKKKFPTIVSFYEQAKKELNSEIATVVFDSADTDEKIHHRL